MNEFLIPLTMFSTDATIYVNPDHIVFMRAAPDGSGTQVVTAPINDGLVLPVVKETLEEISARCRNARAALPGS